MDSKTVLQQSVYHAKEVDWLSPKFHYDLTRVHVSNPEIQVAPCPRLAIQAPGTANLAIQRQTQDAASNAPAPAAAGGAAGSVQTLQQATQDGLTLAIYVSDLSPFTDQATFAGAAGSFAQDHHAVGIADGQLVVGQAAAQSATTVAEVVAHIQATLRMARQQLGREDLQVSTLALFTHGLNDYLNFGGGNLIATDETTAGDTKWRGGQRTRQGADRRSEVTVGPAETAQGFADSVDAALSGTARVVLYACLTGGTYSDPASAQAQVEVEDHRTGGEGSFADTLRDELTERGQQREVWGHRSSAHTTGNPRWRVFDGQQAGEQASAPLFGGVEQLHADRVRRELARQIREQLPEDRRPADTKRARKQFNNWIAREMPFAPEEMRPFATHEQSEYELAAGLVEWYVQRYLEHHPVGE